MYELSSSTCLRQFMKLSKIFLCNSLSTTTAATNMPPSSFISLFLRE
jgi:hypothetical protein